jgi:hypothetical protein
VERIVTFEPAYDKRDPNPSKNYGIHGVNLRFVLKSDKGAVQFVIYTNWMLPHVTQELLRKANSKLSIEMNFLPMPADRGYHSPIPRYEGQNIVSESCEYLNGKPCYYDGSGLAAEDIYKRLVAEGDSAVWEELEAYYEQTFGEEE